MSAEPLFALLQTRHERIEPALLYEALVAGAGLPKADAARASRRSRGILAERLTRKQADGARGVLARQRIETFVLPTERMMKLTPPVSVHWLQIEEAGLIVPADYYGKTETVPWPSVFVISSGYVGKSVEERKPHEVRERFGRREYTVTEYRTERHTEQQHVTEILGLSAEGKMLHFRLFAHRLLNQHIPYGGMAASMFEKYILLLEALIPRCQWAEVSPETRLILTERQEQPKEVPGRRPYDFDEWSFDLYNRWLLQLVMLREQGELGSPA